MSASVLLALAPLLLLVCALIRGRYPGERTLVRLRRAISRPRIRLQQTHRSRSLPTAPRRRGRVIALRLAGRAPPRWVVVSSSQ